jgi:hypothetical protein
MGMSEKYLVDCIHTIICRNLYNGKCIAVQCEAYMAPSGWISVKDRLPDVIGWYLIYNGNQISMAFYFHPGEKYKYNVSGWVVDNEDYADKVTHWQPLPSPPKEGG